MEMALDEGVRDMLEYKDDGYIELVLKLLARICDGQHTGLQVTARICFARERMFDTVASPVFERRHVVYMFTS